MTILAAALVGFLIGSRSGDEDFDQIRRSLVALYGTDEFADLIAATRSQAAKILRELAQIVDPEPSAMVADGDVVARVRHLVGRD